MVTLRYNGVDAGDGGIRWYNPETGKVIHKTLDEYGLTHECTEIEFSRKIIKTTPRDMILHPEHKPSPNTPGAFWINGICSDKDLRITFATGARDKLVISKNEVDFLFCSTDQSFTSCFRLPNGTENTLRKFQKTRGYYITYLTQDDAEFDWGGVKYTHPKMQGRAFMFESQNRQHYTVGRPYGKSGYELRDALRRWLPNGLEIGWELNDEQKKLDGKQYDNFNNDKNVTCHDYFDKTFNSKKLYNDFDILITTKENYKG